MVLLDKMIEVPAPIYPPAEDSEILLKQMCRVFHPQLGTIIEVGTGSGYISLSYWMQHTRDTTKKGAGCSSIIVTDRVRECVDFVNKIQKEFGSQLYILRTLFKDGLKHSREDRIVFNPPYLPAENNIDSRLTEKERVSLVGGEVGVEVIEGLLKSLDGKYDELLLVTSSLSAKHTFFESLQEQGYSFQILDELRLFWEQLNVIKIVPHKE